MATAFLLQPHDAEFEPIRKELERALSRRGVDVAAVADVSREGMIVEQIYDALESADVVVADVTNFNPNVLYELGYVHGIRRPVVMISSGLGFLPFDVATVHYLRYEATSFDPEPIVDAVVMAIASPDRFMRRPATRSNVSRVFLSYSHRDTAVLERLLVHLRPLEREGLIDAWSDRRIGAGTEWMAQIRAALDHARAAVLLVSADFLASDFIVNDELPPLLNRAKDRGSLIVPLIVKPCRYVRDPHLSGLQAINDPSRPLLALPEVEQEQLLDDVVALIERAMRRLDT